MDKVISGNVGIGTTWPTEKLHLEDNTAAAAVRITQNHVDGYGLVVDVNNTDNNKYALQVRTGDGSLTSRLYVRNDGNVGIGTTDPGGLLDLYKASGNMKLLMSGGSFGSDIHQINLRPNGDYGAAITVGAGYSLEFTSFNEFDPFYFSNWDGTTKTRLVTILNSGNVGIGTTGPTYKLEVGTSGDGTSAIANAWNTFSDERYKTNIIEIENALDIVSNLRGVEFDWKKSRKHSIGFIAQEVEKVLPQVVSTDKNGYKSVDYSRITSVLVEAVKKQQEKIEEQEARIKNLEASIKKLQNK